MKKIFLSVVVMAIMAALVSCEKNGIYDIEPPLTVTLMKFKNSSYVNHLIVNDYKSSSCFMLMRGNNCSAGFLENFSGHEWTYDFPSLDGRTPYIELENGWYLVDWPWFMYPLNGQVLLTEVTWDNYNGECRFDKSSPHITGNIYEKKDINVLDLVAYSYPDGNYPKFTYQYPNSEYMEDMNEYRYFDMLIGSTEASPSGFLESGKDCLCNRVDEADALWDLLRTQLNTLISNGDVNSLPKATQEQRIKIENE